MLKRILLHLRSAFFLWNLLIIFMISIIAGFLIVTHGHEDRFYELLFKPGLVASSLYSGSIAFILLLFIYLASFVGNARYAGKKKNGEWFLFQLMYGVIQTILIELLLATILFWIKGYWIFDTAFFDKIFLLAISFIFIANLAYLLFYMQRVRLEPEVELVEVQVNTIRYHPMPLLVQDETPLEELDVSDDEVALFYIRNGEIWKKDFQGRREIWLNNLDATMKSLDPKLYFKCARNWIVHRNAVAEITPISSRRLRIRCRFQVRIELVVSQRNAQDFKDWFYGNS